MAESYFKSAESPQLNRGVNSIETEEPKQIQKKFIGLGARPIKFFKDLIHFLKAVAEDPRIPSRDKKVLLAMIALVISPIDLIPDWIPIFGVMDDIVILALIFDYFFETLDTEVLLSHYPWGMKSFTFVRRSSRLISSLAPQKFKRWLWSYQPDIYKKN